MRQLTAFFDKEWMEFLRSGRFMVLGIVFILFGIMNPAMAKLTPWIMEMASESLEGTGLLIGETTVDALTSWAQFYKNVPLAMIIFLLMTAGTFTAEYQKGTLINVVTKGMVRWKIVVSKAVMLLLQWTALYWMCYGITYGYTAYFWDNGIVEHVFFAALCLYMLGVWLISLLVLMSTALSSNSAVLLLTGGAFGITYLVGTLSEIKKYLPTQLMSAGELLAGAGDTGNYKTAIIVCAIASAIQLAAAIPLFDRRNL